MKIDEKEYLIVPEFPEEIEIFDNKIFVDFIKNIGISTSDNNTIVLSNINDNKNDSSFVRNNLHKNYYDNKEKSNKTITEKTIES